MKSFLHQSAEAVALSKTRRLKPAILARRCVGSLIVIAGLAIVTTDLLALLNGGDIIAGPAATTPSAALHQTSTGR
ncbi:hypothetical protein HS961_11905 [Comamonas piscis]|uniref:Uncharacterized protein n=1 Tax=Comamonas piscis TaxID=1562974 RepID=A0A7G5EBH3_9BURK|nr:hypothetical protein [Comamonas piscis]QMV71348.1 hypothetical protein HS961_11905 [Comamonas piscis]WSO31888.1 hypothetical protein VUJ63_11940 [Comamonas piscis]